MSGKKHRKDESPFGLAIVGQASHKIQGILRNTRSQKTSLHAGFCTEKRPIPRCALIARLSRSILVSLCIAFLLSLAMHSVVNSSAMARSLDPPALHIYGAGLCVSFTNQTVPQAWIDTHVCDDNPPISNPEQTFTQPAGSSPCQQNWIKTMTQAAQEKCVLTLPAIRGTECPIGFVPDNGRCDYLPQNSGVWHIGFCKPFASDEVPPEWITNHVCDINPVPDPEQTFLTAEPCQQNWISTVAEGGGAPKCALTVPATRELCPIGFVLDGSRCDYVPQKTADWQFPCSDLSNGSPDEQAIAKDWLSGDSPQTVNVRSDPSTNEDSTGGRFVHTFAADTYGLNAIQQVFSYMLGLAFVLIIPVIILIGYQIIIAASCFRHAGALEGISHVLLGMLAVGVSFQLVTMLISFANVISSAIVGLHGTLGYPPTKIGYVGATYTLAGASEPSTSYRGIVMPMSRWGCAANDFIGVLSNRFFSDQVMSWFPVIGNLSHLAVKVSNGADLVSYLTEFARLILSIALWLQVVIRIGILNCSILTCPLAFACWALPAGQGQQAVRQWIRDFLSVLAIQVIQLFLITILPVILPSFPAIAGDNGIMQALLTQLPPLLVLWLTVRTPKLMGVSAIRVIGTTGLMAGRVVGAVSAAAGGLI